MEFIVLIAFFSYIYYVRNFADLRTKGEKEAEHLAPGITLYQSGRIDEALAYFQDKIATHPNYALAYLYHGLCHKALHRKKEAIADLKTGLSYSEDATADTIYLELGKIYIEEGDPEQALASFNKSVFHSFGNNPEAYHWRGKVKELLALQDEAQADFKQEQILRKQNPPDLSSPRSSFFNLRLLINSFLVAFTSVSLLYFIKHAGAIHLPYLIAVLWAIAIGFAEPRKGWLLALLQSLFLVGGYFLFTTSPENTHQKELENFALFGSVFLTFAGSFLGAFIKRSLTSD